MPDCKALFTVKPQNQPEQTFYNLVEGGNNLVTLKFSANPAPTTGFWHLHGVEVPVAVGTESNDAKFKSSHFEEGVSLEGHNTPTTKTNTLTSVQNALTLPSVFQFLLPRLSP